MYGQKILKLILACGKDQFLSLFVFALYINDIANLHCPVHGWFILLYADDILLTAPSVTGLQQLLHECEREICWLDIAINYNKYERY